MKWWCSESLTTNAFRLYAKRSGKLWRRRCLLPSNPWTRMSTSVTRPSDGNYAASTALYSPWSPPAGRWRGHPLARPFFGTGVFGGYTTFFCLCCRHPAADPGGSPGIRRPVPGRDAGRCAAGRRRRDGAGTPDPRWRVSRRTQQLSDRCALRRGDRCQQSRGTWVIGYPLVTAGAAVGAPLRHLTDRIVQGGRRSGFPGAPSP